MSNKLTEQVLQFTTRPIVWSIAASDSGGGAGIQADNLTIHDLGGHACNLVTGITAQNSIAVYSIAATSAQMLSAQLNCLSTDMPPRVIKIGVLVNHQQVQLLTTWLRCELPVLERKLGHTIPVIWDPVMLASTGQTLTNSDNAPTVDDYLQLGRQVTLITPNYQEINYLLSTQTASQSIVSAKDLVNLLVQIVKTNVLLTGGDQSGQQAIDWLYTYNVEHTSTRHQQQFIGFCSNKIDTPHNHGTGCTLTSAIATSMALGHAMLDAICIAKAYVNQGLSAGYSVGKGAGVLAHKGWPSQLEYFPDIILPQYPNLTVAKKLAFAAVKTPLQVYPVTQSLTVLEQVLKAGALTAQLRIKQPKNTCQLELDIQQAISLGRQYNAQVFINDHWKLAIKHGAFGVHLGQEDMLEVELEQISMAGLALGLSSHGYFEMLLIQQVNPSYLAVGHIFPTPTKSMPSQPQGLLKLTRYCTLLKGKLPLVAIGGIDAENLSQLAQTQVDDIAVVRAVEQADDPGLSWQNMQNKWQSYL